MKAIHKTISLLSVAGCFLATTVYAESWGIGKSSAPTTKAAATKAESYNPKDAELSPGENVDLGPIGSNVLSVQKSGSGQTITIERETGVKMSVPIDPQAKPIAVQGAVYIDTARGELVNVDISGAVTRHPLSAISTDVMGGGSTSTGVGPMHGSSGITSTGVGPMRGEPTP